MFLAKFWYDLFIIINCFPVFRSHTYVVWTNIAWYVSDQRHLPTLGYFCLFFLTLPQSQSHIVYHCFIFLLDQIANSGTKNNINHVFSFWASITQRCIKAVETTDPFSNYLQPTLMRIAAHYWVGDSVSKIYKFFTNFLRPVSKSGGPSVG